MKFTHFYIGIASLLFFGIPAGSVLEAQSLKDTLHLGEVEIKASYIVKNDGFKRVKIDSSLLLPHLNSDLSSVLAQYSTVFIKTYGNGSIATPSLRGTSANHTQVEWNGIAINSPMLGQTDLSQIPVAQFNGLEIIYGGAGISKSPGAFGGIIDIVNDPDWENKLKVSASQSFASFDTYGMTLSMDAGNQKIQSQTKANFSSSLNNFLFFNDQTGEYERQTNAKYYQYGLSEELYSRINRKNFLAARIWYSQSHHYIPPILQGEEHNDRQLDRALRSMIEWKYFTGNINLLVRSAFVDQFMDYINDTLENNHQTYSWINKIRLKYSGIKNLSIQPGIDLNYDWAISDAYDGKKIRSTSGIFAEFVYDVHRKIEMSLVLRQDLIDNKCSPFIPAFGIEYRPFDKINISFSANVSKNYRYPTLNDLYWAISGNPDLKMESDYAAEGSTVYNLSSANGNVFLEAELTGYYSLMKDLIVWLPSAENSALWKPMNVSEVLAKGIEAGLNITVKAGGANISFNNAYNYCRSTYEKSYLPDDASIGKQQIYIPENTFNSTLEVRKCGFYFDYNLSYTSRRYTGKDNSSYMPGYNLSNIILGKYFHLKRIVLSLQGQINNLFDLDYQSIVSRPMPGRNYEITVRVNFNK
ncbi:MAG: TonB-dependent receptor plug domain-containing protein [Bacteroidota bacterium]|nr:TonB-dependent receptor plug domain-containing protein [Bacteroidota bacterium]